MGDLDGDGTRDVAVAASGDPFGGDGDGCVFLLLLHPDGTVKSTIRIGATELGVSGYAGGLGASVAAPGDLDGDGRAELAIGAFWGDDGGHFYVAFLDASLEVSRARRISNADGFEGMLAGDRVGRTLSALGDLDGDGTPEIATGQDPFPWIVSLGPDSSVRGLVQLDEDEIDIPATPIMATLGDLDGDGTRDLALGFPDEVPFGFGVLYVCFRCTFVAATEIRNTGGTNPASLTITTPELGATIEATVDLATTGHGVTTILGYAGALTATLGGGQVLLVDVGHPSGELLHLPLRPGPLATYSVQVPRQLALCGVRVSAQALHLFRVQPYALSNAVDLTLGPAGSPP